MEPSGDSRSRRNNNLSHGHMCHPTEHSVEHPLFHVFHGVCNGCGTVVERGSNGRETVMKRSCDRSTRKGTLLQLRDHILPTSSLACRNVHFWNMEQGLERLGLLLGGGRTPIFRLSCGIRTQSNALVANAARHLNKMVSGARVRWTRSSAM